MTSILSPTPRTDCEGWSEEAGGGGGSAPTYKAVVTFWQNCNSPKLFIINIQKADYEVSFNFNRTGNTFSDQQFEDFFSDCAAEAESENPVIDLE